MTLWQLTTTCRISRSGIDRELRIELEINALLRRHKLWPCDVVVAGRLASPRMPKLHSPRHADLIRARTPRARRSASACRSSATSASASPWAICAASVLGPLAGLRKRRDRLPDRLDCTEGEGGGSVFRRETLYRRSTFSCSLLSLLDD